MKKLFALLLAFLFSMGSAHAQIAQTPPISAKTWVLLDLASGQVITSHHPHTRIEPESFTKLMTAYLAFNAIRDGKLSLNEKITVSDHAWKAERGGWKMYLNPKVPVSVRDLLLGLIVVQMTILSNLVSLSSLPLAQPLLISLWMQALILALPDHLSGCKNP